MMPEIKEIIKENKKTIIALASVIILFVGGLLVWFLMPGIVEKARIDIQGGKVIEEKL